MNKATYFFGLFLFCIAMGLSSCEPPAKSADYFSDCATERLSVAGGVMYIDTLHHYSIMAPDSAWPPMRVLEGDMSQIVLGDTLSDVFRTISIMEQALETSYDFEEERIAIAQQFDVVAQGQTLFFDEQAMWQVINGTMNGEQCYSFYLTVPYQQKSRLYVISMLVCNVEDPKPHFCEMLPILESIELY